MDRAEDLPEWPMRNFDVVDISLPSSSVARNRTRNTQDSTRLLFIYSLFDLRPAYREEGISISSVLGSVYSPKLRSGPAPLIGCSASPTAIGSTRSACSRFD
ncbi:hypothetical protein VKT23_015822 [Stygiomarasmius scandens]|uniref:Uncharacterized protein n=1 Tax=Marasmiellus scandens TaxID=2682957 RepID=A0ABR1IWK4_9AGAR